MRVVVWRADWSRVHVGEGHGGGADDEGSADLCELDTLAELVGGCHGVWGRCAEEDASMGCGDQRDGADSKKEFRDVEDAALLSLADRV